MREHTHSHSFEGVAEFERPIRRSVRLFGRSRGPFQSDDIGRDCGGRKTYKAMHDETRDLIWQRLRDVVH